MVREGKKVRARLGSVQPDDWVSVVDGGSTGTEMDTEMDMDTGTSTSPPGWGDSTSAGGMRAGWEVVRGLVGGCWEGWGGRDPSGDMGGLGETF